MARLTEHFDSSEFGWTMGERSAVDDLLKAFCNVILEPIRREFGPLRITSGYRDPAKNADVGGVSTSAHVWSESRIAADFQSALPLEPSAVPAPAPGEPAPRWAPPLSEVFDWIRLRSGLPFDQVILEHSKCHPEDDGEACIHISLTHTPRRMALIGETHGAGAKVYTQVEVAGGGRAISNLEELGEA